MITDFVKYTIDTSYSVKQTIEYMEKNLLKAVIISDKNLKVLGLFSDGDMRSFVLRNGDLSVNITEAMNKTPVLFHNAEEINNDRKKKYRIIYPIVDEDNHLIGIEDFNTKDRSSNDETKTLNDVPLVIQAGGKGTRLYPYTKILPKPLIPIGDKSITERIIDTFAKFGCKNINMIVNYKSNMIKAYFRDGSFDYDINFIDEKTPLGTGGGLKLLTSIKNTFFLTNCDVLVNVDYECVYKTHKKNKNDITFICSLKNLVIPYGVINTDAEGNITEMKEKPDYSFLVNTGVYVIEPSVLKYIEKGERLDFPDLARRIHEHGGKVGVFPISEESWMDMGQFSEMDKMKKKLGLQNID